MVDVNYFQETCIRQYFLLFQSDLFYIPVTQSLVRESPDVSQMDKRASLDVSQINMRASLDVSQMDMRASLDVSQMDMRAFLDVLHMDMRSAADLLTSSCHLFLLSILVISLDLFFRQSSVIMSIRFLFYFFHYVSWRTALAIMLLHLVQSSMFPINRIFLSSHLLSPVGHFDSLLFSFP